MAILAHHGQLGLQRGADAIGLDMAQGGGIETIQSGAEPVQSLGDNIRHVLPPIGVLPANHRQLVTSSDDGERN
jgi:hypothetical protein